MDSVIVKFEDSVRSESGRTVIRFHVIPGSSKSEFAGYDPWRASIKVNVINPAKKGAANEELLSLLSRSFSIKESEVEIVSGVKSRSKSVSIKGMGREEVLRVLTKLLGEG